MDNDPPRQETSRRARPSLISIVVPVFNERGNIRTLAGAVAEAIGKQNYELLFVDDGSTDGTFDEILDLSRKGDRIRGISLARNFGHQCAISAGLYHSRGQVVITMDGDMQHPPDVITQLIDKWRDGFNLVQTKREDAEKTGFFKRLTSGLFYRVFSVFCGVHLDAGMADFRLLDESIVRELNRTDQRPIFLRGLLKWMGYREAVVSYTAAPRHEGKSKYTTGRMLRLAKHGLFSFSTVPLRIGIWIGLLMALASFAELVYAVVMYFLGHTQPGWASIIFVISFLFGMLFLLIGLQGEYLLQIYRHVQHRPPYLVERTTEAVTLANEPNRDKESGK